MKFSCTQENLARGLSVVTHVAGKNVNLPVLSNVLIKAEGGVIRLLTTNLEIAVNTLIRGKVEKEGQFTVQAKLLGDYVTLLPKERVDVELRDKELYISCGSQHTSLRGSSAEEFPLVPEFEKKGKYVVGAIEFKIALSQSLFAVATDETRPEISGLLFRFSDKDLVLVGTDSYRLAERRLGLQLSAGTHEVIVPYRSLAEIARIIVEDEETVAIYWSENQLMFVCGETELTTRVIEGHYPDYQQIIPKNHHTRGVVDVEEFMNLVKTAGLFSRSGVHDIRLEFYPAKKEIVIQSQNSQVGENRSVLKSEDLSGTENTITFNYRYLVEGLSSMRSDKVALELIDDANPGVVRPLEKEKEYLYMVMPIKQ